MIVKDTMGYVVRAKTGWGSQDSIDVGWYIGYVIKGDNVVFFVNCIQIKSDKLEDVQTAINFDRSRSEIVDSIFKDLNIFNYLE